MTTPVGMATPRAGASPSGPALPSFGVSYGAGVREAAARLCAAQEAYPDAVSGAAPAVRTTAFRLTLESGGSC
ncbi:MAG: hypothetical protein OXQ94_01350 [Gemmatimonadota bacterium]|nr:hypothetical protein [Gemmatimonadota bacterium]MDE2870324.1 hypothetical protein [Gemmatimonadota bacterium]